MTIKEFAALCGCNTQTLRYYDKINLLKPDQVDPWSGYRYYTKSQAIDFVKIKNLQAADFSIDEIKALLAMPDHQINEAFDRKIAQQQRKLEKIKEIKQTYLHEKSDMEKLVTNIAEYLLHAITDFSVLQEFGISPCEGPRMVKKLKSYIEKITAQSLPGKEDMRLMIDDRIYSGTASITDALESLKKEGYDHTVLLGDETVNAIEDISPENSETIWSCHGWHHVYEFLKDIPKMDAESRYCFYFRLTKEKERACKNGLEFPMFMIAAMLTRDNREDIIMGCEIEKSPDEQNHISLLKRKV